MDMWAKLGDKGIQEGDARWKAWFGDLNKGPVNAGCFPGETMDHCMDGEKTFPNRTSSAITVV